MPTLPHDISTSQAAERLGLSREHVRRLIQRGELRAEESVNGFMLDASEVERYAFQRQVLQDQRQFRAAVDDLAAQARHVDGATGIQSAVAQMRDQMKLHPAFDVPAVVAQQINLIKQEIATQRALIGLAGPAETMAEQWHRYSEDARRAAENITTAQAGYGANFVSAMDHATEKTSPAYTGHGAKIINATEESMSKTQEQAMGGISARNEMLKGGNLDAQRATAKMDGDDAWQEELRRRDEWETERRRRDDIARGAAMPGSATDSAGIGSVEAMRQREQKLFPASSHDSMRDQDKIRAVQEGGVAAPWLRREERLDELRRGTIGQQDVYSGQSGSVGLSDTGAAMHVAMLKRQEDQSTTLMRKDDPLAPASLVTPRLPGLARGFVVAESHEARLEEKVDELDRKVEQLTALVMQQRADTTAELPTWQQWAGSDRPEDVLAKLVAIREEITGEQQTGENSTDVIREAREARGKGE